MSETSRSGRESDTVPDFILKPLIKIRSSFLWFTVAVGVVFILLGIAIGDGPIAGILPVLGVSAWIYALLGMIGLRLIGYT